MAELKSSRSREKKVFSDLFKNIEKELPDVIKTMEVSDKISLLEADELPECVYELLEDDPSEEVKAALRRKKSCMVAV